MYMVERRTASQEHSLISHMPTQLRITWSRLRHKFYLEPHDALECCPVTIGTLY